ncbi:NUDIX hydrolase [Tsuneonella amylolytica]
MRAVVLDEDGEVLLVRPHGYRDGEWTLAGGSVEEDESPVEGSGGSAA